MGLGNKIENLKQKAIVSTAVIAGTVAGAFDNAQAQGLPNSPTLDTAKPTTEESIDYQKIYADKIYQRNENIIELKNSLDKKAGEVHTIALQIKNKIDNPFNSNDQKLKDLMIVKFYNIDAANEYLSKITDMENSGLLEIFNDAPSKDFSSLLKLNKPLMEYKNIIDKIKELFQETQNLASMADSNAPIAPDQIPTTMTGTNLKQKDMPMQKVAQPAKPTAPVEIHLEKHPTKAGEILRGLGDDMKNVASNVVGIFVDKNGCNCVSKTPEIFR